MSMIRSAAIVATLFLCVAAAPAGAEKNIPFKQLFERETRQPLRAWSDAGTDGSRKLLTLTTQEGVRLRGWFYPSTDPKAPFVVTFRGNGETIADARSQARDEFFNTALNLNVVTFDYRGTGFSDGALSLSKARADALDVYDFAVRRAAGRPVFVCGWSLGSIFASHVAGTREVLAGLILLDPMSSIVSLLAYHGRLAHVHFDIAPEIVNGVENDRELRTYRGPLLIVHGMADGEVPIAEGRADYAAAASSDKTFVPVAGKGHSGTIWSIEASEAIVSFVLKHSRAAKLPD